MHKEVPLVSVVIPCHNQSHFLAGAIESALGQSHPRIEVIVVDDGTRDEIETEVAQYPTVRYIKLENRGLGAARNAGARFSKGSFLIFLDANDYLYPEAARHALEQFRVQPDAGMVFGNHVLVDESGKLISRVERLPIGPNPYESLLQWNPIGTTLTTMIRRSVLEELGGFSPDRRVAEEYDFWLRLTRRFKIAQHSGVVGEHRVRTQKLRIDGERMMTGVLRALRNQWPHVSRSQRLRSFYRFGVRYWRQLYIEHAIREFEAHVAARRWRRAGECLVTITRNRPMRVLRAFFRWVRARLRGFRGARRTQSSPDSGLGLSY
jgi:glycosyltransferase involved in cell wall biosynthesis